MMTDVFFVDEWVILDTTAPVHGVTTAVSSATLQRTTASRFLGQEHHATKTGLVQGSDTPTPKGTDHTPSTMGTYMGDTLTDHNHTAIPL